MALLPPFFLDTVVAIGAGDDSATRKWIGTGFIIGKAVDVAIEISKRQYAIYIVTNKHVVKDQAKLYAKFNSANDPLSKDYAVDLKKPDGTPIWVGHPKPNVDVAVIRIDPNILKNEGRLFQFFQLENHSSTKQELKSSGTTEGDRVFVLGFPMGLVSTDRQYVICRGGCLARIRDFLEDKTSDFIIDASVFPGNSGGPVVSCPSAISITGTQSCSKANLIGIVKSYISYQDVAISQQTGRARIVFEENSGLTSVESVDSINETIQLAETINSANS